MDQDELVLKVKVPTGKTFTVENPPKAWVPEDPPTLDEISEMLKDLPPEGSPSARS